MAMVNERGMAEAADASEPGLVESVVISVYVFVGKPISRHEHETPSVAVCHPAAAVFRMFHRRLADRQESGGVQHLAAGGAGPGGAGADRRGLHDGSGAGRAG